MLERILIGSLVHSVSKRKGKSRPAPAMLAQVTRQRYALLGPAFGKSARLTLTLSHDGSSNSTIRSVSFRRKKGDSATGGNRWPAQRGQVDAVQSADWSAPSNCRR